MIYSFKPKRLPHDDRYFENQFAGVLGWDEALQCWSEFHCKTPDKPTPAWYRNKAYAFYRIAVRERDKSLWKTAIMAALSAAQKIDLENSSGGIR